MVGVIIVLLAEIKNYIVIQSFLHKNDETKNPWGLQFKAEASRKACFLFRGNRTYLSRAGGSSPPSLTWLRAFKEQNILNQRWLHSQEETTFNVLFDDNLLMIKKKKINGKTKPTSWSINRLYQLEASEARS